MIIKRALYVFNESQLVGRVVQVTGVGRWVGGYFDRALTKEKRIFEGGYVSRRWTRSDTPCWTVDAAGSRGVGVGSTINCTPQMTRKFISCNWKLGTGNWIGDSCCCPQTRLLDAIYIETGLPRDRGGREEERDPGCVPTAGCSPPLLKFQNDSLFYVTNRPLAVVSNIVAVGT